MLAVGAIHGNEADGTAIIDRLAVEPVPAGVELWLVRSMNPDGQARSDRQNANAVDLNRNFPENWDVLGEPGFWQYGGSAPASEPETKAMVALGASVQPQIILWYHQDLFRIAPGSGRSGEIRTRYADVAGLPIVDITGGTYTGTASQGSRTVIPRPVSASRWNSDRRCRRARSSPTSTPCSRSPPSSSDASPVPISRRRPARTHYGG